MLVLLVILRLLHIVAGIFWVGAALLMTFIVTPAARATQESGQKFLSHMMQKTPFNTLVLGAAFTSVLAGLLLYWIDSDGLTSAWMASGPGLGFGLGGVSGLLGLYFGILISRRSSRLMQLGAQIQSQGSPPTEEQAQTLQTLQKQLKMNGSMNAVFLLLAAVLMATARFWVF
ncbi:MAG TPA: hypothetical protein VJ965_05050 [Anaerolineales bacterium]|nr:hypothetical protein [Anaerolineales bacterium]